MLTNRELIEMIQKWLTFCESSWLFGSCGKVLHCELSYWANIMKKFSFTFWISWELLIDKRQLTLSSELSCWNHWCVFCQILMLLKSEHHGYWYCTENLNEKMFCVYAFCCFWQLLRYMIIYWTYEQTVSENVKCPLGKIRICERNADWILPRDTRSRYNHESLGHRVGICEIIYFGFNLKDKESSWWISF